MVVRIASLLSFAGIGFACAQALGLSGCRVLLADIDRDGLSIAEQRLQESGINAATVLCDVGNKEQARLWLE